MSDRFEDDSSFDGADLALDQKKCEVLREKLKEKLLKKIHEVSARDFREHGNFGEEF